MKNALKRDFKEGQYVYVVDYWGTKNGTQAFEAGAAAGTGSAFVESGS